MKDLDYYLEELARKRTTIDDEDEIRNQKGRREDWLDEEPEDEPEDDFSSEINDDEDAKEAVKEKLKATLEEFSARNSKMSMSEAIEEIIDICRKWK